MFQLRFAVILCFASLCSSQYTSQTFPDPRIDPLNCRMSAPAPLCDPSGIIPQLERIALANRINELLAEVASVGNTSPACDYAGKKLEIIVAVMDKIGTMPMIPVDIEKFTNSLKARYQNFKDVSTCDNTIVIVNSKSDRQVYTVAGRDVRMTKEVLRNAFLQNLPQFKAGYFAVGLQGMVEYLITAYKSVHGVGVETSPNLEIKEIPRSAVPPFAVNGVQTTDEIDQGKLPVKTVEPFVPQPLPGNGIIGNVAKLEKAENESDQLWIEIMQEAVARCGSNQDRLSSFVQAVVDEAMSISLRLISDPRYTAIEEAVQTSGGMEEARVQAWQKAKNEFIDELYKRYIITVKNGSVDKRCPAKAQNLRFVSRHWN